MKPFFALFLMVSWSAASSAFAQSPEQDQNAPTTTNNTCFASVIPDMVHGDYSITGGPLAMTIGGKTMYPDPETTGRGLIYPGDLREYVVRMVPPIPEFRLEETDALQPEWFWDKAPTGSSPQDVFLTSDQIEATVGCRIRDMPRFIGKFETSAQDGTPLDHTLWLVMVAPDLMLGSWRFTAQFRNGPAEGLRYVIFRRTTAHIGN